MILSLTDQMLHALILSSDVVARPSHSATGPPLNIRLTTQRMKLRHDLACTGLTSSHAALFAKVSRRSELHEFRITKAPVAPYYPHHKLPNSLSATYIAAYHEAVSKVYPRLKAKPPSHVRRPSRLLILKLVWQVLRGVIVILRGGKFEASSNRGPMQAQLHMPVGEPHDPNFDSILN